MAITSFPISPPQSRNQGGQVTDGVATKIVDFEIPLNQSIAFVSRVNADRVGGVSGASGDSAFYILCAKFKNIAGTITQVGNTVKQPAIEDQPAWDADFVISSTGTRVELRFTGASGNNIDVVTYTDLYQNRNY